MEQHLETTFISRSLSALRQPRFAKNVAVLSGGTLMGQALAVAASPIVTRLYSPAEYGVLGVFMSALSLVSVAAMLRYEIAVPISDTDTEAANVCGLSILLAAVSSVACGVVAAVFGPNLFRGYGSASFEQFAWLLPIAVFVSAVYQCLSFWSVRKQDYRTLARTKWTQSCGMVGTQILLGAAGTGALGLMIGQVIGRGGGIGLLARQFMNGDRSAVTAINRVGMRAAASKFNRFPKYSLLAAFIDTAIANLPILFVASLFGIKVAGWYTLVQRVLFVPAGLLTASVSQVYLGEMADVMRTRPAEMRTVFARRSKQMAVVGAGLSVLVVVGVVFLVPYVFGDKWASAAVCGAILSPLLLASVVISPFGCTLDILNRQDLHLTRDVLRGLLLFAGVAAMYSLHVSWTVGMAILSVTGTLGYGLYWSLSWYAIDRHVPETRLESENASLAVSSTAS